MNTLVIYDNAGFIIQIGGTTREPIGVPFLWVEIPQGKQIKITNGIGVDLAVTPHKVILEDIPKTEIELAKERIESLEQSNAEMMNLIAMQSNPTP